MLFAWHSQTAKTDSFWKDPKTVMLVFMVMIEVVVICDYSLVTDERTHNLLIFFTFGLVSLNFVAICYSYISSVAVMLDEYSSILLRMQILAVGSAVTIIAMMILELVSSGSDTGSLCKSWFYTIISAVNIFVNCMIILQAKAISKTFDQIKER